METRRRPQRDYLSSRKINLSGFWRVIASSGRSCYILSLARMDQIPSETADRRLLLLDTCGIWGKEIAEGENGTKNAESSPTAKPL